MLSTAYSRTKALPSFRSLLPGESAIVEGRHLFIGAKLLLLPSALLPASLLITFSSLSSSHTWQRRQQNQQQANRSLCAAAQVTPHFVSTRKRERCGGCGSQSQAVAQWALSGAVGRRGVTNEVLKRGETGERCRDNAAGSGVKSK